MFQFGTLAEPDDEVLGEITDAVIDDDGRILLLDGRRNRIVRIENARVQTIAGSPGRGPGELVEPTQILIRRDGVVGVVDPRAGRLQMFGQRDLELIGSISPSTPMMAACFMGDSIVVHNPAAKHVAEILDSDGTPLLSFGEPFADENAVVRQSMSRATLLCLEDRGQIAVLFTRRPELRLYAETGALLWRAWIPNFIPMRVTVTSRTSVSFGVGASESHHLPLTLEQLDSATLMVQIGLVDDEHRSRSDVASVSTFLVNLEDGHFTTVDSRIPPVVAVRGKRLLATTVDPFPRAMLLQIQE